MADRNMTKAERRAARAAGGGEKQRKRADAAEGGKKKKGARRKGEGAEAAAVPPEDASFEERLDWRLTRLEEAVAAQSRVSEELLERMNAVLSDAAPDAGSEKS
jgi:hypothetical protein